MSYMRQHGYYGPGLGLVGPDQPWTPENAGKVIVPATDGKKCDPVMHKRATKFSEFAIPKTVRAGEVVEDTACFKTGVIWEARKPGLPRSVQWCCPKEVRLPPRKLTYAEQEEWQERCVPTRGPDGTLIQMIPGWRGAESYVGSSCTRTGVYDGGYELVCCPPPIDPKLLTAKGMIHSARAPVSEEQQAEWDATRNERLLEQEQARQDALPEMSFFSRYGLVLGLVFGTVGIAVTAALLKRRSVAKKKAKEAEGASEAVQENTGGFEPRLVNGTEEHAPGPKLDVVSLGPSYWEVYWLHPGVAEGDFIGTVRDFGGGGYSYGATAQDGATGSHNSVSAAAEWLAKRTWRVV